jgi:hypothetical protein
MRTSRFAIASCTALIGLGTLVSQAIPSAAGTPPKQGTIVLDQSGDTINDFKTAPPTTKPAPKPDFGDFKVVSPPVVDPPAPPAPPVDPEDWLDATPQGTDVQDPSGQDDCIPGTACPPEDGCVPDSTQPGTPDEQCPEEDPCRPGNDGPNVARSQDDCCPTQDGPTRDRGDCDPCRPGNDGPNVARSQSDCCPTQDGPKRSHDDCDDPCRPEGGTDGPSAPRDRDDCCPTGGGTDGPIVAARSQSDCCPTEGGTDGGPQRHYEGDSEDCPGTGTTGGTDGGTTGGSDGRLPKTGGDVAQLVGAGMGLTALGAALRRIARR